LKRGYPSEFKPCFWNTRDLTKNKKRTNIGVPKKLEPQNTCGAKTAFFTQYFPKTGVVFEL
jgi:hypothetical protein